MFRVSSTRALFLPDHNLVRSSLRRCRRYQSGFSRFRPNQHVNSSQLRPLSSLVICSGPLYYYFSVPTTTSLENHQTALSEHTSLRSIAKAESEPSTLLRKVQKAVRLITRFFKLLLALSPMLALYPVQRLLTSRRAREDNGDTPTDVHDIILLGSDEPPGGFLEWYLNLCLQCTEWSGAAVVKLMQWAGSRPDLFGHEFCSVFSQLQDETTPHRWKHTEKAMREAYGENWNEKIELQHVLGSGCIGQVYKGVTKSRNGPDKLVAVKVLHPNVQEDIDSDLDLMRLAVRIIRRIPGLQHLKWLNMEETVEEFAHLLKLQLDLRVEAANLRRFNENFAAEKDVVFPKLIDDFKPTRAVLVETFCDGVPVLNFAKENRDDKALLHKLCLIGIRAVCKMIFVDNFMHADLHPGNVFISPRDETFVILDVGMVNEYTDADHLTIVGILSSFIRADGRKAGQLLVDDSNSRLTGIDRVSREEEYIDKIEALTLRATTKDYLMERLGSYISYICEAAATHHVMVNQAFVSAALAVKVQEGIALALDPAVEIWRVANPIILKSELRRRVRGGVSIGGNSSESSTSTR